MKLQGNDNVEDIVAIAASGLADEAFTQNGMQDVANDHTDEWYYLMEDIREAILSAVTGVIKEHSM